MNRTVRHLLASTICLCLNLVSAEAQNRNAFGNPPPEVFEAPDRDTWQRPDWVLDQLALRPNDIVADIGAGSGYFSRKIATRIPEGRVIAIDIDPGMLAYLDSVAARAGVTNIGTRLAKTDDPGLAPESVDLIFLTNTLHHIENRPAYYPLLVAALRPGGRIVNIDFYKRDLPVGPRHLDHKLAKSVVIDEFTRAGLFVTRDLDGLPHQYFLEAVPLPSIPNAILLDAQTITAGEPTFEQLGQLARLGFKTVLNLQTLGEGAAEEGQHVEGLGMDYINIPIVSSRITDAQIDLFSEILTQNDRYPMLIHCRSSNRVGGLLLLHQALRQNKDLDESVKEARRAGLKQPLEERLLQRIAAEK